MIRIRRSCRVCAIQSEQEDEHTNGGHDARLSGNHWLHIPDYGAVILEKVS